MSVYNLLPVKLFRLRVVVLFLVTCVLSACMNGTPAPVRTSLAKGPIQLYDRDGKLICQVHGQNPQFNCLEKKAVESQFAAYFIDYALDELASDLHVNRANLPSSGLNISTTLDLDLQKQVLQKAKQYIATMAPTHNMTNAAVIILDYHNGAIRSLVGSLDSPTTDGPLNVVTKKARQVGSVFKPFVYANAFEQGISPGEVVYDGPFSVGSPPYSLQNYDRRYHGYMSYRSALQNNYNIPALKLYVKTGFDSLRKTVQDLGIQAEDLGSSGYYSLPLGPMELPLLDATVAYGTMANGGIRVPPRAIEKISASDGSIIYAARPQGTRALSPQTAFMITDVMSDNNARSYEYGQCSPFLLYTTSEEQCQAGNPGPLRPAAAHGGLSDTFRDSMAIGYTTDLVAGAWTGNSNFSLMFNVTSRDGAARIWHDSLLLAEGNEPIKQFPGPPAGVVKKTVSYPGLTTTDWYVGKS